MLIHTACLKILFWRIDAVLGIIHLITHDSEQPQKIVFVFITMCIYNSFTALLMNDWRRH